MSVYNQFEQLVARLWAHRVTDSCDPKPPGDSSRARPFRDLATLHAGLEEALVDVTAFDELFEVYLATPGATDDAPLPDGLRGRILQNGLGELSPDELVRLAASPVWIAELWDAMTDPSPYWRARSTRAPGAFDGPPARSARRA